MRPWYRVLNIPEFTDRLLPAYEWLRTWGTMRSGKVDFLITRTLHDYRDARLYK
jgi:hypothetical protein